MSDPINFVVTKVGLNALQDASDKSIKLSLTKVGLGSGQYVANSDRTALSAQFTENGISAGGVEVKTSSLRFTVIMNHQYEKLVSEIGLFTSTGVLFAVASVSKGSFFRLYPSIDYVANFGLSLDNTVDAGSIAFKLDGRGGEAVKVMQQHLDASDPHPQYKNYSNLVIQQHIEAPDPHPQYVTTNFLNTEVKKLDAKINSLLGITAYLFPPLIEGGYSSVETSVATRRKGANYSWLNKTIVYHFCPEEKHEGWTTTREATQIKSQVFARSGLNRVGYSGRSNYIVIDTERSLKDRGFTNQTNQLANEIKSGVIEVNSKYTIQRESWEAIPYNSDNIVVILTPEGVHEGWEIKRNENSIDIEVFNRATNSNTRIAYSGRVNYSIFKANSIPLKRDEYPFNLITGVADKEKFTIPAPVGYDFTDPNFFPLITPEGIHEGWTVKRTKTGFDIEIFHRYVKDRIEYKGKTSWAVFMLTKSTKRTILGAGNHSYKFKADCSYRITLVGGGGAGGNAIRYHSGATPLAGQDGGDTTLNAGNLKVQAYGGKGGIRGCWNNGSAYRNGASGAGGAFSYEATSPSFNSVTAQYEAGTVGIMSENNVGGGGVALYGQEHDNAGHGGKGAVGSGTSQLGYGGSGGGAASGLITFNCVTDTSATIKVGAGGKFFNDPEEYYQKSWNFGFGGVGSDGIVVIEETEAE